MSRLASIVLLALLGCGGGDAMAQSPSMPTVEQVAKQPLLAHVNRLRESLELLGNPLNASQLERLERVKAMDDEGQVTAAVQAVLDPLCLFTLETENEAPPTLHPGQVSPQLMEQGWRTFLIKVVNPVGIEGD